MVTIPVYDIILLPGVCFYFRKEAYEKWNLTDASEGESLLFLLMKEQKPLTELTPEDFCDIGFSAHVESIDSEAIMTVRVDSRVRVIEVREEEGTTAATISPLEDVEDITEAEKQQRFEQIRESYPAFISGFPWGVWVKNMPRGL